MKIDCDELYPYYFEGPYGVEVEMTEEQESWVRSTLAEFDKVQEFLSRRGK